MATITLNNEQLRLIQKALDLYSRIGILQLDEILSHPTIDSEIDRQFSPNRKLQVGDKTMRGTIVEIKKNYIKTKGSWGNGEEIKKWTDVENVKFSPDWGKVHDTRDEIKNKLEDIKTLITGNKNMRNASFGIYQTKSDESCREAYDIIQVIRHEFWKENPKRSFATVDSSITKSSKSESVIVKIDTIKDIRKEKMKKITNKNNN